MENSRSADIRNTVIPLAVSKPSTIQRMSVSIVLAFYLLLTITYLSSGYLHNYYFMEIVLSLFLLCASLFIYDKVYMGIMNHIINISASGVVIGFSNKIMILMGEEVLEMFDTDEISVRDIQEDELDTFFTKVTTILEMKKNGEVIGKIGVDKLKDYEGLILKQDASRIDEDLEIIFDDDFENDDNEGDLEGI